MRILALTYRFPYPPDRGDRLTMFHLLRAMSARHRITLLSFVDGTEPAEAHERVAAYCERIETVHLSRARSWGQAWLGLPASRPSQVSFYASGRMQALADRVLAEGGFDVVFAHTLRIAPYVLHAAHPLKVLWLGDSLGNGLGRSLAFQPAWKRPGIRWERHRVDRFEAMLTRHYRETWAISEDDRADFLRIGCERIELVTHGVDEDLFALERRPDAAPRIMFLGNLSVPHNVDACVYAAQELLPRLRAARPDVRLVLAGADPAPVVRRLGEQEGVEVTGPLPDLRPQWSRASVLLAPLRFSTGIQNKVLEAMAAGVPVVTTTRVADGIGASDGALLLAADDADGLARSVLTTLAEPAAAAERTARARAYVRARFSWDTAVRRIEQLAAAAPAGGD